MGWSVGESSTRIVARFETRSLPVRRSVLSTIRLSGARATTPLRSWHPRVVCGGGVLTSRMRWGLSSGCVAVSWLVVLAAPSLVSADALLRADEGLELAESG